MTKPKPKPTKRMAGPLPKKQVIGTPSSRTNGPAPMRDSTGRAPTGKSARFLPSGGALDSSPSRYNGKPNLKGIAYAPPSKQGARNKVSAKGNAAKQGMAAKAVVARATNQAQMNANFKAQLRETQAALAAQTANQQFIGTNKGTPQGFSEKVKGLRDKIEQIKKQLGGR